MRGDAGGEDAHSEGVEGRGGSSAGSSTDVADVDASVLCDAEVESEGVEALSEEKEAIGVI